MGRYAHFNTDFEYKFAFGVQPSEDIQEFSGTDTSDYKHDGPSHTWTEKDREDILFELKHLEEFYGLVPFNFSKYEKNIDGTYELRRDFQKTHEYLEAHHYKYMLGLLIYHQLEYMSPLTVSYEL